MENNAGSDLANGRFSGFMEMSFVREGEEQHPSASLILRAKLELMST
jgi:hypothetical protein